MQKRNVNGVLVHHPLLFYVCALLASSSIAIDYQDYVLACLVADPAALLASAAAVCCYDRVGKFIMRANSLTYTSILE